MVAHGFFDRNGSPFFGTDADDDGGFQYQQLSTSATVDKSIADSISQVIRDGLTAFPVCFFVPGPIQEGEQFAYTVTYPTGIRILGFEASTSVAPTGSDVLLDVTWNGASVFLPGNLFAIPDGQHIGVGNPDATDIPNMARLSFSVIQVGSIVSGSGLAVTMLARGVVPFVDSGTNQP